MTTTAESLELVQTVEPEIRSLMDTHRERREHWYAHEVVPWEQGRNYRDEPWDESQASVSRPVRTALVLNLLTEDNLPYYHARIAGAFPADSAMAEWSGLWTAEEGQHSIAIRDFLLTSRNCDPRLLEEDRLATVSRGWSIGYTDPVDIFNYTSAQELATRVSHRNAGVKAEDPIAYEVMNRVAVDENHHFMFYRGVTTAMLREAPSLVVRSLGRVRPRGTGRRGGRGPGGDHGHHRPTHRAGREVRGPHRPPPEGLTSSPLGWNRKVWPAPQSWSPNTSAPGVLPRAGGDRRWSRAPRSRGAGRAGWRPPGTDARSGRPSSPPRPGPGRGPQG